MPQFNTFPFNHDPFNGNGSGVTVYSTNLVVFDSFSLSDNVTYVVQTIEDSEPTRELIGGKIPRADGEYLIADYYRDKDVTVRGLVIGTSAANLETNLDTMRKSLRKQSAFLDVTRNGVVRRYVATLTNGDKLFAARQGWNITICPFEAVFACKTPFATDRDYTGLSQAITSSPTSITYENLGTYKAPAIITMVFDAASSVTVVDVLNTTTSEEMQYNPASIAAGDILLFDGEAKSVTKNSVAIPYSGSFISAEVGSNNVQFSVTGTSFNAYCSIKSKYRYL